MRIELNGLMTKKERDEVESVLRRASERKKPAGWGEANADRDHACGIFEEMTWDERDLVNAILQKAEARMPEPLNGADGDHYRLHKCRCLKHLEVKTDREKNQIKCSDYLGKGLCRSRLYICNDELPFA